MRILIDTNIILDILLKREPFFESSYGALKQAIINDIECLVSATAVTDIFYLLRKGLGGDTGQAKESLERLLQIVMVADVIDLDIHTALSDSIPDFEDSVVHAVAVRHQAEYIMTRNTKDFAGTVVPAITPQDFLKL